MFFSFVSCQFYVLLNHVVPSNSHTLVFALLLSFTPLQMFRYLPNLSCPSQLFSVSVRTAISTSVVLFFYLSPVVISSLRLVYSTFKFIFLHFDCLCFCCCRTVHFVSLEVPSALFMYDA